MYEFHLAEVVPSIQNTRRRKFLIPDQKYRQMQQNSRVKARRVQSLEDVASGLENFHTHVCACSTIRSIWTQWRCISHPEVAIVHLVRRVCKQKCCRTEVGWHICHFLHPPSPPARHLLLVSKYLHITWNPPEVDEGFASSCVWL